MVKASSTTALACFAEGIENPTIPGVVDKPDQVCDDDSPTSTCQYEGRICDPATKPGASVAVYEQKSKRCCMRGVRYGSVAYGSDILGWTNTSVETTQCARFSPGAVVGQSRGRCNLLVLDQSSDLRVSATGTGYFTSENAGVGVEASWVSVSSFTETMHIVCYSADSQGLCSSIVAKDENPLSFQSAQFEAASVSHVAVAVLGNNRAAVCYMTSTGDGLRCRLAKLVTATITYVGTFVQVTPDGAYSLSLARFGDIDAALCYNRYHSTAPAPTPSGGRRTTTVPTASPTTLSVCNNLRYNTVDLSTPLQVGPESVMAMKSAQYMSVATTDAVTAIACYQTDISHCTTLVRSNIAGGDTESLVIKNMGTITNYSGNKVIGGYPVITKFDEYQALMCYQSAADGYTSCLILNNYVYSDTNYSYNMVSFTCGDNMCIDGKWFNQSSTCSLKCRLSDIPTAPTGSIASCPSENGAANNIGLPVNISFKTSDATTVKALSATTAIVCSSTTAVPTTDVTYHRRRYSFCHGLTKSVPNKLSRGSVASIVNNGTSVAAYMSILPTGRHLRDETQSSTLDLTTLQQALLCYSDTSQGGRGICQRMSHNYGEVYISRFTKGFFTSTGVSASRIVTSRLNKAQANPFAGVVCYATQTAGMCTMMTLPLSAVEAPIVYGGAGEVVFASAPPVNIQVDIFSTDKLIICWEMQGNTEVYCQSMLKTSSGALEMGNEPIKLSLGYIGNIQLSLYTSVQGVICYHTYDPRVPGFPTHALMCNPVAFDGTTTLALGGSSIIGEENLPVTALTIATTGTIGTLMCYTQALAPEVYQAKCVTIKKSGAKLNVVHTADVPNKYAPSSSLSEFTKDEDVLCYINAVDSTPKCLVVEAVVNSGESCAYKKEGYSCSSATCNNGKWSPAATCERTCMIGGTSKARLGSSGFYDYQIGKKPRWTCSDGTSVVIGSVSSGSTCTAVSSTGSGYTCQSSVCFDGVWGADGTRLYCGDGTEATVAWIYILMTLFLFAALYISEQVHSSHVVTNTPTKATTKKADLYNPEDDKNTKVIANPLAGIPDDEKVEEEQLNSRPGGRRRARKDQAIAASPPEKQSSREVKSEEAESVARRRKLADLREKSARLSKNKGGSKATESQGTSNAVIIEI